MGKAVILSCLCLFYTIFAFGAEAGIVSRIDGKDGLFLKKSVEDKGAPIEAGKALNTGDFLQTGKDSSAEIILKHAGTDTTVRIRKNSLVKIVDVINSKKKNGVFLFFGRIWSLFKGKGGYAVETYNSVAGVEGTEFEVAYDEAQSRTILYVIEGRVRFYPVKAKLPGIPVMKIVTDRQIAVCQAGKGIRVLEESSLEEYLKHLEVMTSDAVPAKREDFAEPDPIKLLFPENKSELVCDSEDGASLLLKFLVKEFIDRDQSIPFRNRIYLWIDGCNYYKGHRLEYTDGAHIRIDNLSHDLHTVRILSSSYQHEITIDMSDPSVDFYTHEVTFKRYKIGFLAKTSPYFTEISPGIIETDFRIYVNGQRIKLSFTGSEKTVDPEFAYVRKAPQKVIYLLPESQRYFTIKSTSGKYSEGIINIDTEKKEDIDDFVLEEKKK